MRFFCKKDPKEGFSLIEMLVSIAIFSVVIVISVSALLSLMDANRKAQSLKSVMNNLNFALETMARNIATGLAYYCDDDIDPLPSGTRDCQNGAIGLALTNDQSDRIGYRLNGSVLERQVTLSGNWIPLTSSEVLIEDMRFYVTGTTASDSVQPSVTISIRGKVNESFDTGSVFNLETTVTQRILDE